MKLTTSRGATVATIFTVILVIAALCTIIIMQTSNASASNVIYKQKIRGDVAVAQKTITQGSNPSGTIFIDISAKGFTTTADLKNAVLVSLYRNNEYLANRLSLNSAIGS